MLAIDAGNNCWPQQGALPRICFPVFGAQCVYASKVLRAGLANREALIVPVRAVLCNAAVTRLSTFADALHPKISLRGHLLPHSIALSMPLLPGSGCDLLGLLLAW